MDQIRYNAVRFWGGEEHTMRLQRRTVALALFLVIPLSQISFPQATPDQVGIEFLLTALTKNESPAVLQEARLSVAIDKSAAQLKAVRSAKSDPLVFAVLVDISKSDAASADSVREAAFQVFQGLATGDNQGYVVLFNDRVAVSPHPIPASQAKEVLNSTQFGGGTALYDAIALTCKQSLSRSTNPGNPRRVILLISDGDDNSSHIAHAQMEQATLQEGVSVFSVMMKSPFSVMMKSAPSRSRGETLLKEISRMTGGVSIETDLKSAVPLVLAAINAQSIVTVVPSQSRDNKLHSVQVKSTQKDIHIYAPTDVSLQ
jgi:VWFA-related protein